MSIGILYRHTHISEASAKRKHIHLVRRLSWNAESLPARYSPALAELTSFRDATKAGKMGQHVSIIFKGVGNRCAVLVFRVAGCSSPSPTQYSVSTTEQPPPTPRLFLNSCLFNPSSVHPRSRHQPFPNPPSRDLRTISQLGRAGLSAD